MARAATPEVDLCVRDPGYEVSLDIEGTVAALARVCLGQIDLPQALKAGEIEVRGAPRYRRALSSWLGVSHFSGLGQRAAVSR